MSSAVYISSLAFTPAIVAAVDSWGEKIGGHEIAKNVYTSGHGGGSYVYLKYWFCTIFFICSQTALNVIAVTFLQYICSILLTQPAQN